MIVISAPDKLSSGILSSRKKSNSPEREHGVRRRERHRDQIDEVPRPPILAVQEARPDLSCEKKEVDVHWARR